MMIAKHNKLTKKAIIFICQLILCSVITFILCGTTEKLYNIIHGLGDTRLEYLIKEKLR